MMSRNPLKLKSKPVVKAKKSQPVKAATTTNLKKNLTTQLTLVLTLSKFSVDLNISIINNIISSFMTDEVLVSVVIKKTVKNLKRVNFVRLNNIKNL